MGASAPPWSLVRGPGGPGDPVERERMGIYVDELVWESRGRMWCHLLADSAEELHGFAIRLGLPRSSFHSRPGRPWRDHYDVPDAVRPLAVRLGAAEITFHQAGAHVLRRRQAFEANGLGSG